MVYFKTEMGQSALANRSLALTPRQRAAFIMFDGKKNLKEVLKASEGLGITEEDVVHMVVQGLLASHTPEGAASAVELVGGVPASVPEAGPAAAGGAPTEMAKAHYSRAYPIATRLTAGLGLRGFLLNLAVESASDLAKLQELAPKIKQAVGPEKFRELQSALYD